MPIVIIDGFQLNSTRPIDYRIVASSSVDRLGITYSYDGLKVFQQDDRKTYIYNASTLAWDVENGTGITGSGATGYMPYFNSASSITNGVMYQGSGNIGINTNNPQSLFQLNGNFFGSAQPITMHIASTAKIGYNWYNNGVDQAFSLTQGSSRISFGDGDVSIDVRLPGAASSAYKTPVYISASGEPTIYSDTNAYLKGNTVIIGSTTSTVLSHAIGGGVYYMTTSDTSGLLMRTTIDVASNTFSMIAQSSTTLPTHVEILGNSSFITTGVGSSINITGGFNTGFFDSWGGSVNITGGVATSFFLSGNGGTVSISGGLGQNNGGNVLLSGGYGNTSLKYNDVVVRSSNLNLTNGGATTSIFATTSLYITAPQIRIPNGSLTTPALSFGNSTNTGVYYSDGVNGMTIMSQGAAKIRLNSLDFIAHIHNTGGGTAFYGYPSLSSGTYIPGVVAVTNCTASTNQSNWSRVGNVVTVSGKITIDPTSASTLTSCTITNPITTNFNGNDYRLNGVGKFKLTSGSGDVVWIDGGGTNAFAKLSFFATQTAAVAVSFIYHYLLLDDSVAPGPSPTPTPPSP